MPPWVATVPRLSSLIRGLVTERLPLALRCRNIPSATLANLRARSASTHVSPTAINLRPNIPPRNKELHNALSALTDTAKTHVNISRLQLALQGLAAQDAVTRVAILGLNSQVSAQQLARLLLADPLGVEEHWENELGKIVDGNEKAVLLKYGDEADPNNPTPLYRVLSVPSRVLRSHNLEILVSTLNINVPNSVTSTTESFKESVLMPKLQAPSTSGVLVLYPVHKTLIFGEGLDSAIEFGRFSSDNIEDLNDLLKVAINLPAPSEETDLGAQTGSTAVNVRAGAAALTTFRESIQNAVAYEKGWYQSGLPSLTTWLTQDLQPSSPIRPVMKTFISSILDDIDTSIAKEDAAQLQKLTLLPNDQEISASVTNHLETWAEKSHTELRDELDDAFSTRNWHKLAWWKLLWRVDDVSMISSEILERRWLVSAEKSSIYLAGRMNQAGFPDEMPINAIPEAITQDTTPTSKNPITDISTEVYESTPWPEHIAAARTSIIAETIPPLQALAQRLILQTFSTTSISSALSALLYISMPTFSLFEASAAGFLGLMFSLRRMQKLWEGARESWEGTVREEGRRTLKRTEEVVRLIIQNAEREKRGLGVGDEAALEERKRVSEVVGRVREELKKLG
ncbi:hypothetical protein GQ44DRAFT_670644 [Phaeosphaeriaceae sp. PMI808]|nr:hypothetical protein GQ44DRAFT_670644 [Phaeosphaeriaceae sp. PMI808]